MRKVGAVVVFAAVWLVVPSVAGASLHMPRQDRREIDALLDRFVPTALPRRHLAQAYDLVTPRLRGGLSRAAWAKSDVPVYPFPAARLRYHTWEPLLVTKNAVELSLFVQPRRGAKVGPIDFEIDLKRLGGRWLVDDVSIAAIFPAVGSGRKVWSGKDTAPALAQGREVGDDKGRISRAWIALPLGLVTLAILFPLGFFLHRWRQDRRAVRAYELSAGDARAAGP
jgi:hypothetical protein